MISLKKYLDMDPNEPPKKDVAKDAGDATKAANASKKDAKKQSSKTPGLGDLSTVVLESYRSALLAMGESGAHACPAVGSDLQQKLAGLESGLGETLTSAIVSETETHVEESLLRWGESTAEYLKTKTNEVKELLVVLASTAESIGEHDQRYADRFKAFTAQLKAIGDLETLSQVRSSLIQCAAELKSCVDQMAQASQRSVSHLKTEVTAYETKLKVAEEVAAKDSLTGLVNRRKAEERIEWRIEQKQMFCVAILDLERFKQVNDTYGHPAGDNLLQQFSQELRSNSRSNDIVGRWGGDEFIIILDCDLSAANTQVARVKKWALGEYTLEMDPSKKQVKLKVDASVGVTQFQPGQSLKDLIASADSDMYRVKALARGQGA